MKCITIASEYNVSKFSLISDTFNVQKFNFYEGRIGDHTEYIALTKQAEYLVLSINLSLTTSY